MIFSYILMCFLLAILLFCLIQLICLVGFGVDLIEEIPEWLESICKYFNNLKTKKMNFKILGKAMGYMFMPTLGVLATLLVGFFDPTEMWNFIKSDNGWAIFIRIAIFIAEIVLVWVLYYEFLNKEERDNAMNPDKADKKSKSVEGGLSVAKLFGHENWREIEKNEYCYYKTNLDNIVIVEFKVKEN